MKLWLWVNEKFRVLKELCGHFFNPPTESIWSIYRDICMVPYKTFVILISGEITSQINTAVKLNTHEMRTKILQHQVAQQQPIQVKWGFLNLNCTTGPKKFSINITMAAIFSWFYLYQIPGHFFPALWVYQGALNISLLACWLDLTHSTYYLVLTHN